LSWLRKTKDITYGELVVLPLTCVEWRGAGSTRSVACKEVSFSQSVCQSVGAFFNGSTSYRLSDLLEGLRKEEIIGKPKTAQAEHSQAYSTRENKRFEDILWAWPALSSFCVQMTQRRFQKERRAATKSDSELRIVAGSKTPRKITWDKFGEDPLKKTKTILLERMPVTFGVLKDLASPRKRRSNTEEKREDVLERAENTVTHALSALLMSFNRHVKLLPAAMGVFLFGSRAQQKIFDYGSRIGHTPGYKTTYNILKSLATQQSAELVRAADDRCTWYKMITDNIQSYHRHRDERMWNPNQMATGLAATAVQMYDWEITAPDVEDRQRRWNNTSVRKALTFKDVSDLADREHALQVARLQWLRTLVVACPRLRRKYIARVDELYHGTRQSRQIPPTRHTKLFSMKTNNSNEQVTTELHDGVIDFLTQLGHKHQYTVGKIMLIGGDGLTYEKLLKLKEYMQMHPDLFDSLAVIEPYLEAWHAMWTDLTRIYEHNWIGAHSRDPSTIGKCSNEMGRKPPSNLKKVDYYPAMHTAGIILDALMLDGWR
jgi:hypothetical protein